MKVCAQLARMALLTVLAAAPAWAAPGSVSGVIRDSSGVPQIGARVELLRPDLSVAASAWTNDKGQYVLASVLPGRYALKATNSSFLPSLREGVKVRNGRTIVNLTLNTLYEVVKWLPAQPRSHDAQSDDWAWTLRAAEDRPLLRWLEDGPLVVASDGSGSAPKLKARIMATGQEGTFGESGERISATLENTPNNSRELLARVDFAPDTDAGMKSMLGFRQDLGYAGAVQSVAEIDIHPEMEGAGNAGVDEAALSSRETMHLGDLAEAEVGSTEAIAHSQSSTVAQSLPFASVAWRKGNTAVRYRMATVAAAQPGSGDVAMPRFSARNGELVMEHGLHQEIGWERRTEASAMAFAVFSDDLKNPALEARARLAEGAPSEGLLFDPESGLAHAAGPEFSSAGFTASWERRLPGGNRMRLAYANGNALVMPALPRVAYSQMMAAAHARRVQAYSISLSGTLEGSGTRWRASYRWQPDDTVTAVAPFAMDVIAPYLNLHVCQRIRQSREGTTGIEALVDVQNLLSEGYRPYMLSDGSVLIFAQGQRALRGGLAFTF